MPGTPRAVVPLVLAVAVLTGCTAAGSDVANRPVGSLGTSPSTSVAASTGPPGPASTATPGPAPATPGQTLTPVPEVETRTQSPVALTDRADFGRQVSAEITGTEAVTTSATGPGQISGEPAVAFTMTISNGTTAGLALDGVTATVAYGADATPAPLVDGAATRPFSGTVPAGGTAEAVYVFAVPADQRQDLTATLSYLPSEPTVVFKGAVS